MHIAVVVDQKVPCVGYEGTERQVHCLATELVRRRCRDYAAERLSIARTADGYIELYRRLLDGETLP